MKNIRNPLIWLFYMALSSGAGAVETVTYLHNDVAGTPMMATDAAGNLLWKENYRPYGDKLNNQPAAAANSIGFTGKPFDNNTGLSYMGARYYDPVLGRFTGIDPVEFDADNLHSFNRYAYANNNPYRFVDPDGRSPIAIAIVFVTATLIDAGLQYAIKSEVNFGDAAIAGLGAVATGGAGAIFAQQAIKGLIRAETAVARTMVAGASAGGTVSALQDVSKGDSVNITNAALNAAGGAAGAGVGSAITNKMASTLQKMEKSGNLISNNIAGTTRLPNAGNVQPGTTIGQELGKSGAEASANATVKLNEKPELTK